MVEEKGVAAKERAREEKRERKVKCVYTYDRATKKVRGKGR